MPDERACNALTVIGVEGDDLSRLGADAMDSLVRARLVVGGRRLLAAWERHRAPRSSAQRSVDLTGDIGRALGELAHLVADRQPAVLLASGDPGFFGVLRSVLGVVERSRVRVLPARSSVSLAFASIGLPWDDALVVSAHGRPLDAAVALLRGARKAAVLTSPDNPPEVIGRALREMRASADLVAVCSNLGTDDELVAEMDLDSLARGSFDPLSVLIIVGPGGLPILGWQAQAPLAWGLPDSAFAHRAGMVTKAEVRAVVLGKLALPPSGVLWDVGAGSGSVAVECARLCPGLAVFAVEADPPSAARVAANASNHSVAVHVIEGRAPEVLVRLPDPDRAFVGGGGPSVLDAVIARMRPGGTVVASFASLGRASDAATKLGNLVQIGLARAAPLEDGSWRLAAENPVFVAWGPEPASGSADTSASGGDRS